MLSLVLSALGMAGTQPTIAVANGFDANASAIPNLTIGKLGSCSCQVPKDYEPRLRVCIAEVLRTALTVALWVLLSLSLSYYNSWQDVKASSACSQWHYAPGADDHRCFGAGLGAALREGPASYAYYALGIGTGWRPPSWPPL